jgi:hypothetical protein
LGRPPKNISDKTKQQAREDERIRNKHLHNLIKPEKGYNKTHNYLKINE